MKVAPPGSVFSGSSRGRRVGAAPAEAPLTPRRPVRRPRPPSTTVSDGPAVHREDLRAAGTGLEK